MTILCDFVVVLPLLLTLLYHLRYSERLRFVHAVNE